MIYVTDLQGNSEPLNGIQRIERTREVGGGLSLAFTSFSIPENHGHKLVQDESIVTIANQDYRIKQIKESKARKEVVAISTFFDLVGNRKEEIYGGTRTFNEFASFVFAGTGWTFNAGDVSGSKLIPNFGTDNVVKLVQLLADVFECEYEILPNNTIQFNNEIGPDNDFQYRYQHNIKVLSKSVYSSNLRTAIRGYGGEGVDITVTSDNAAIYGVKWADPVHEEEYSTTELMTEHLTRVLSTMDKPEIVMEMDVLELTERELGERVWLIYEPHDVELKTRILATKSAYKKDGWANESVEIGNTKRKTLADLLAKTSVKIDENDKRHTSRIEQTNDRITLAVEEFAGEMLLAYSKIELTAQEIRSEVVDVKNGLSSTISQLAGIVSLKAESSTVDALGTRVNTAEININAVEGQISSKVSQTDYNGNAIASLINQTATTIDIQASKINLRGAVTVLSELSDDLGTITAGNINLQSDIRVGKGIYLQGVGKSGVYFSDDSQIFSSNGKVHIEGLNDIDIVGTQTNFYSRLDFSNAATIIWGNNRPVAVWG